MGFKKIIKKFLEKNGVGISHYPGSELKRRVRLLDHFNIDVIFDIGANTGQYASLMFEQKFKGKIISFEPLSDAYKSLSAAAKKNSNWTAENMAVGDMDGEIEINVSENSFSSSILSMLPNHLENAPQSKYINKEKVSIHKLDTIYFRFANKDENVFLKIDTQGYEKTVLNGADKILNDIKGIQIELSLVPLYSNGILFQEMITFLQSKGFSLYSFEEGFSSEKTGQLFQVDGIFFKDK